MTPFDYSTPPPQSALNLIPAKTIALVRMSVNAGMRRRGWHADAKQGRGL